MNSRKENHKQTPAIGPPQTLPVPVKEIRPDPWSTFLAFSEEQTMTPSTGQYLEKRGLVNKEPLSSSRVLSDRSHRGSSLVTRDTGLLPPFGEMAPYTFL